MFHLSNPFGSAARWHGSQGREAPRRSAGVVRLPRWCLSLFRRTERLDGHATKLRDPNGARPLHAAARRAATERFLLTRSRAFAAVRHPCRTAAGGSERTRARGGAPPPARPAGRGAERSARHPAPQRRASRSSAAARGEGGDPQRGGAAPGPCFMRRCWLGLRSSSRAAYRAEMLALGLFCGSWLCPARAAHRVEMLALGLFCGSWLCPARAAYRVEMRRVVGCLRGGAQRAVTLL